MRQTFQQTTRHTRSLAYLHHFLPLYNTFNTQNATKRSRFRKHYVTPPAPTLTTGATSPPPLSRDDITPSFSPKQFPPHYYGHDGRLILKNLTLPELEAWCASLPDHRPPEKRAMQLWRWMYYDRLWIRSLDDVPSDTVQNGFSSRFRDLVRNIATVDGGLELQHMHQSSDGARKLVFKLTAGPAIGKQTETVIIPITRETGSKERITLCVSSQVGCAMACQFCYTGRMGLLGHLTPAQIVEQVVVARRLLFEEDLARGIPPIRHVTPITNIVYMGQGEPCDNLPAVLPSIDIITQPLGLHLSSNKVTVSTVGLIPQMRELAAKTHAVMAVSLHAPSDEIRDAIVPVNRRYPLQELVSTMEELFPKDKSDPRYGNHVLVEYTMLSGVNDKEGEAVLLLDLLKNVRCKINLIVFNPHEGTQFKASTPEAVAKFRNVLIEGGHVATVRSSRGDDTMAACGQLGNLELSRKKV